VKSKAKPKALPRSESELVSLRIKRARASGYESGYKRGYADGMRAFISAITLGR
jgi:hypothetical protein